MANWRQWWPLKRRAVDSQVPTTRSDKRLLAAQARLSGDPFSTSPYYDAAEAVIAWQWDNLVWPMIEALDFSCVVDLAAGHGRNSERLKQFAQKLIIVDINQECIDACKARFGNNPTIHYVKNDGFSLQGIDDASVSLLYSFDAMVHFDSDVIKEYLKEFYRVLQPGGKCFCHHSNYTLNPGGDFKSAPHWRNFMSKELFAHYGSKAGLEIVEQKVIDWVEPNLDCLSILEKPSH